jgi:peptide methionine sulfoxide reductase msrA/msrB
MSRFKYFFLFVLLLFQCSSAQQKKSGIDKSVSDMKKNPQEYNQLTDEEKNVILYKGTERPFTGKYYLHKEEGTYICKQCDAPLYRSSDKFESHCGWPSFDDEIEGAIKRVPDKDGRRVEILCNNCGGHLGHVFEGEGFTAKNVRHCVNSISINFVPAQIPKETETAIFAGGCFWGVEYYFSKQRGVISTQVGYIGGTKQNPSYKDVCYTNTGHAEAVRVVFDPKQVSFETLCKLFFEIHDPTQIDRQGPDVGEQYRSEVFYTSEKQKEITSRLIQQLKLEGYRVATKLTAATTFWPAEEYHQMYYEKNGKAPYCHKYTKRFKE